MKWSYFDSIHELSIMGLFYGMENVILGMLGSDYTILRDKIVVYSN